MGEVVIEEKEIIEEKVLIDLIDSPSVQRLKDISQFGVPDKYYFRKGYSRFEHSTGVFILLKKLGASLEEQVAGLLHDVSHTAFSHVVDWISGDPTKENYQDDTLFDTIKNSELPKILQGFGFNYKRISNHENFSLLEKEAPSLCADRIDYSLRELFFENPKLTKKVFENLGVKDNQIVFQNKNIAEFFAKKYASFQINNWASNQAKVRYVILSNILKKGIEEKIISFEDLEKTESYVLNKLENSNNEFVLDNLNILEKGFNIVEDDVGIELLTKFRYIDPEVSVNGHYQSLSSLSKNYFDFLEIQKENFKTINKVRIIPK